MLLSWHNQAPTKGLNPKKPKDVIGAFVCILFYLWERYQVPVIAGADCNIDLLGLLKKSPEGSSPFSPCAFCNAERNLENFLWTCARDVVHEGCCELGFETTLCPVVCSRFCMATNLIVPVCHRTRSERKTGTSSRVLDYMFAFGFEAASIEEIDLPEELCVENELNQHQYLSGLLKLPDMPKAPLYFSSSSELKEMLDQIKALRKVVGLALKKEKFLTAWLSLLEKAGITTNMK